MTRTLTQLAAAAAFLAATEIATAGTVTWTDADPGDSLWNTPGNWTTADGSTPPAPTDNAFVQNGTTAIIDSTVGSVSIHDFQLRSGSTLEVRSGGSFQTTVAGHDQLLLADSGGTSYVVQTGGVIDHANTGAMYWGRNSGNVFHGRFSAGQVQISNATAPAAELRIGAYGSTHDIIVSGTADWDIRHMTLNYSAGARAPGTFRQQGTSTIDIAAGLIIGNNATYYMEGGTLTTSNITTDGNLINSRPADFVMSGGTVNLSGGFNLNGNSTLNISGGSVATGNYTFIGQNGTAAMDITGGTVGLQDIYLGMSSASSIGTLSVRNGATLSQSSDNITLHRHGSGTLLLGDATSSGTISGTSAIHFGDGSGRSGTGLIRGWGSMSATSVNWGGDGTQPSKIVADGYGTDRSLQFPSLSTVTQIAANEDLRDGSGWYAQNHGKLELAGATVTAATANYNWGESSADTTPDLVNSARLTFTGLSGTSGTLTGALLAIDRDDVPEFVVGGLSRTDLYSVHDFTLTGNIAFSSLNLTIRYDEVAAAGFEDVLQLFHYTDGAWVPLLTTVNTSSKLVSASVDSLSLFAIGYAVPEPSSMVLLGLAALGMRRRR